MKVREPAGFFEETMRVAHPLPLLFFGKGWGLDHLWSQG